MCSGSGGGVTRASDPRVPLRSQAFLTESVPILEIGICDGMVSKQRRCAQETSVNYTHPTAGVALIPRQVLHSSRGWGCTAHPTAGVAPLILRQGLHHSSPGRGCTTHPAAGVAPLFPRQGLHHSSCGRGCTTLPPAGVAPLFPRQGLHHSSHGRGCTTLPTAGVGLIPRQGLHSSHGRGCTRPTAGVGLIPLQGLDSSHGRGCTTHPTPRVAPLIPRQGLHHSSYAKGCTFFALKSLWPIELPHARN